MKNPIENRTLFTGDNLEVMRAMNSETVDLIYLDPPFNKKIVFPIGKGDSADFGFKDIWGWDSSADETNPFLPYAELYAFDELLAAEADRNPLIDGATARTVIRFLETMGDIAGHPEMAYLSFMATRLVEMQRVLKPRGSIYLHCDQTMSHSIKLLMDVVFGGDNFRNEIVWVYAGPSAAKRDFPRKHDVIFRYVNSEIFTFNADSVRVPYAANTVARRQYKEAGESGGRGIKFGGMSSEKVQQGKIVNDWWADIPSGGQISKAELTGYPTQKPIALLERIIKASSGEGDLVLDPFCGCATTCVAAERLGRRWIGIDVASHAANLVKKRLLDETKQGKLGDKEPPVHHRKFDEGDCPSRTDLGETRSRNIRQKLYGTQSGNCRLCGRHFELRDFHLDHVIPRAKGGPDADSNLQLLCGSCNTIKSTKTMQKARQRLRELGYV